MDLFSLLPATIGLILLCDRGNFGVAGRTPGVEHVTWPLAVALLPEILTTIAPWLDDLIFPQSDLINLPVALGITICPLVLVLLYMRPKAQELGLRLLRPWPFVLTFICTLLMAPLVFTISGLALRLSHSMGIPPDSDLENILQMERSALIVKIVLLLVVAPLFEELVSRGLVFTAIRSRWGPWRAALACNLLFALGHHPSLMLYAFLVGMFLTLLYEKSGSIVPSIIGHMLMNSPLAFGLLILFLEKT